MQAGAEKRHFSLIEQQLVKLVLPPEAHKQYEQGAIAKQILEPWANTLKSISALYTSRGAKAADAARAPTLKPFRAEQAKAYALYYLPVNFVKLCFLIQQCNPFGSGKLKILDFGCGPGTGALAAFTQAANPLEIHLHDRSTAMLDFAQKLLPVVARDLQAQGLRHAPCEFIFRAEQAHLPGEFDLIIAANVINEIASEKRLALIKNLAARLNPHGQMVLLEPALSYCTRELMALRDEIISAQMNLTPLFPCTHAEPCPMLQVSATDWCHGTLHDSEQLWSGSALLRTLDNLTGFNKHRLKYAAFVFQRAGEQRNGLRIVSEPVKDRRGVHGLVCGPGYFSLTGLDRDRLHVLNRAGSRPQHFDRIELAQVDKSQP